MRVEVRWRKVTLVNDSTEALLSGNDYLPVALVDDETTWGEPVV